MKDFYFYTCAPFECMFIWRCHHDIITMQLKSIKTVSQYFAAGGLAIGMLIESPVKETEKALAFKAVRHNGYGNAYQTVTWLPKSQLTAIENDYYTQDAPSTFYVCPIWLYRKSFSNGETL